MDGSNFLWSILLSCALYQTAMCEEISSCEILEAPLHGVVNQTADTAWFNCSEGYMLQGSEVIYCNSSNRMWVGETKPNCSKVETKNSNSVRKRAFEPFKYLGCYNDVNIYNLKVFPDIGKYDPFLTLERCWKMCSSARTAYFGVEQSNMCFCGKEGRNFRKHGLSTKCIQPCAGNNDQICGGQFAIDVYNIAYSSCEVLEAPMYGTVYQTTDRARFSCVDGYFLLGSKVIHCNTSTYKWDGETHPKCLPVENDVTKVKNVEATAEGTHHTRTTLTDNTMSYEGITVGQIPSWLLLALILPSVFVFMVIVLIGGICLLSKYLSLKYSKNQESTIGDTENPFRDQNSPGYLTPAGSIDQTSPGYLSPTASVLAKRMPSEVFHSVTEEEQPYEVLQTYHNCNVNHGQLRDIRLLTSTFTGQPCLGNGAMSHFI